MKVEDKTWIQLRGQYLNKTTDFWIEKETSLLRKVEQQRQPDEKGIFYSIGYIPKINVAIPDKAFDFNPPVPKLP